MHLMGRSTRALPLVSSVIVICAVAVFVLVRLGYARIILEDVLFTVSPSAELAFAYGERHFDAEDPVAYDINRAAYFFDQTYRLDPQYHYVNHELARIAFLRGDFAHAIAFIDAQITLEGTTTPNSYYIRGLIEGYMGKYDDAIRDYAIFVEMDPNDWAAKNDYAWVLLKAGRFADARDVTLEGLSHDPGNPWLLNSNAIALYELGDLKDALNQAETAKEMAANISEKEWLHAYPGNDPRVAATGIATFHASIDENIHRITLAFASSTVQSK